MFIYLNNTATYTVLYFYYFIPIPSISIVVNDQMAAFYNTLLQHYLFYSIFIINLV